MSRILVGWDGSEAAERGLDFAARLARAEDELVIVTVVPAHLAERSFLEMLMPGIELPRELEPKTYERSARERVDARVAKLDTDAKARGVVRVGDAADEILGAIHDEHADHLVVGYKSYETALPYNIGSVAEKLVRYASVPITVHRSPARQPARKR